MALRTPGFQRLLDKALALDTEFRTNPDLSAGCKLGHHDNDSTIVFYDVRTTPAKLAWLRAELDSAGVPYRFIVDTPSELFSNILLLDIDV